MVINVRDGKEIKGKPTPGLRERTEMLINKLLLSVNVTSILSSWVEVEKMSLRLFRQEGLDRICTFVTPTQYQLQCAFFRKLL